MKAIYLLCFFLLSSHLIASKKIGLQYLNSEDINIETKIEETSKADNLKVFTATELHKLPKYSSQVMSPDGKYLVYQQSVWDPEGVNSKSRIHILQLDTKIDTEVTFEGNSPTFAASYPGILFFLSAINKISNIRYIEFPPTSTSKVLDLTQSPVSIDSFKIAGNALGVAYQVRVFSEFGSDLQKTATKLASKADQTYEIYDSLFANHWDVWNDNMVNNIFFHKLIKSDGKNFYTDGNPSNILEGINANSPIPPFGGSEMYDISPVANEVVFTVSLVKDEAIKTNWRIYTYDVAKNKSTILTDNTRFPGRTQNPKYDQNGDVIYFQAMPRDGLESDYLYITQYTKATTTFVNISDQIKYSLGDYIINNNTLIATVDFDGNTELFSINLKTPNKWIQLTKEDPKVSTSKSVPFYIKTNSDNSISAYITESSDLSPPTKFSIMNFTDNSWTVSPTSVTPDCVVLETLCFNKVFNVPTRNIFHFKGTTNPNTQGWIMNPINFDETKKYPVAFLIHGGPEGSWGNHWSTRWNPLLWASHGFVTVTVNPEGSTGWGQDYVDAVRNNWGSSPYTTLMAGLDYIGANFPYADITNSCAAGASYGGYMVNWIQGNTKRFKCLVTHDGVFSLINMFYMTDEMWFPLAEYCPVESPGCTPYNADTRENYTKYSPDTLVANWSTPHLIIHGTNDLRIPISEGISAFTALKMKNVPSKFIHFQEENHWVLKPENSIGWYENVLGWFDTYLLK